MCASKRSTGAKEASSLEYVNTNRCCFYLVFLSFFFPPWTVALRMTAFLATLRRVWRRASRKLYLFSYLRNKQHLLFLSFSDCIKRTRLCLMVCSAPYHSAPYFSLFFFSSRLLDRLKWNKGSLRFGIWVSFAFKLLFYFLPRDSKQANPFIVTCKRLLHIIRES